MTNRRSSRRYRKTSDRRVWVFSELNHDLRPEQIAKIITAAGLEQARLEVEAQAVDVAPRDEHGEADVPAERAESDDGGGDHA